MQKSSSAKAEKFEKLRDKEYRDAYASALIEQGLAYQIKSMRVARGLSQADLASQLGLKSQSAVSRLEDPSYGKHSLQTLKKLGQIFDVGLSVRYISFSRLISENEDLSPFALNAVSFSDECERILDREYNLSALTEDILRSVTINSGNGGDYTRVKGEQQRVDEFISSEDLYVDEIV